MGSLSFPFKMNIALICLSLMLTCLSYTIADVGPAPPPRNNCPDLLPGCPKRLKRFLSPSTMRTKRQIKQVDYAIADGIALVVPLGIADQTEIEMSVSFYADFEIKM